MSLTISYILCARNEPETTADCLRSLAAHNAGHGHEVIVTGSESACTDALAALGQELFGAAFSSVFTPAADNGTPAAPAAMRNAGAAMAQGDLLFFLDATSRFTPNWLAPLLAALATHPHRGAVSPLALRPGNICGDNCPDRAVHAGLCLSPLSTLVRLYEGFCADHAALAVQRSPFLLAASSLLMPRALFLAHSGFDTQHKDFEDADLCARLVEQGHTLLLEPASRIMQHEWQDEEGDIFAAKKILAVSPALLRLAPDLEQCLERDGYFLDISGWANFYAANTPEANLALARRFTFGQQENTPEQRAALKAALCAEPLWYGGYTCLASLPEK